MQRPSRSIMRSTDLKLRIADFKPGKVSVFLNTGYGFYDIYPC